MEGISKVPMLAPEPLVQSAEYDQDFVMRIKEYILLHYQDDPSNFDSAIQELVSLKSSIGKPIADTEMTCVLKRYLGQLQMMKNRFPMEEGEPLRTLFSWYERTTDTPHLLQYEDINLELCAVMFNIGAIHAAIAQNESREDEDSVKRAFMNFQYAAWPFQCIRDQMNAQRFESVDFERDNLTFFANILLAQALECLVEKSILGQKSPTAVAAIAAHTRDLYAGCFDHLCKSSVKEVVASNKYKLWKITCEIKKEFYGAIATLQMGMKAHNEQKMGDRLGWYEIANSHLDRLLAIKKAEQRPEMKASLAFLEDIIAAMYENAKKENGFIYHERVPKEEDLLNELNEVKAKVDSKKLVKPLQFDPLDRSICGEDMFGALLPPTVLKAVSRYEALKDDLKRKILNEVDNKDQELKIFMASLELSELNVGQPVTSSDMMDLLMERNAEMVDQPELVPNLLDQLDRITKQSQDAELRISDLMARLNRIEMPELRSDQGYKVIGEELLKLRTHHQQAKNNNIELHKAIAAHTTNLHLLCLPFAELSQKIAVQRDEAEIKSASEPMQRIVDKVREMEKQRNKLVDEFCKELTADQIARKLLAERDTDDASLFDKELKKHDKQLAVLRQNLVAQENILRALTDANADIAEVRAKIRQQMETRNNKILALIAAFDTYKDVVQKAEDGKRFFSKLLERCDKIKMAVEGMESVENVERQKKEKERREVEERLAAARRAKEAMEAVNEFKLR